MISQETIQELKDHGRLSELIGEYVELKKRGSAVLGLCPFHAEKSPSFSVSDERGFFHCFGCGESGNAITFLMKLQGLSFPDAVRLLCERWGVALKLENEPRQRVARIDVQKIYRVLHITRLFYQRELERADRKVQDYLQSRELSESAMNTFAIGFAPDSWNALTTFLLSKRVPEELLLSSGVSKRNRMGDLMDVFRGRLMFPIHSTPQRVCAFGGRLVPGLELETGSSEESPKYINSPESAVYHKNRTLYGLAHALPAIRQTKEITLVEGYMDVIGLWQAGVRNAVATCGTAVTSEHLRRLDQLSPRARVLFDGDSAGVNAAAKLFPMAHDVRIDMRVVFLPTGEDPDSYARAFKDNCAAALDTLGERSLLQCFIERFLRESDVEDIKGLSAALKTTIADQVAKVLSAIENPVLRTEMIREASFELAIGKEDLKRIVESQLPHAKRSPPASGSGEHPVNTVPEPLRDSEANPPISTFGRIDREILLGVMAGRSQAARDVLHTSELVFQLHDSARGFIEDFYEIFCNRQADESMLEKDVKSLLKDFGPSWIGLWREAQQLAADESFRVEEHLFQCLQSVRNVRDLERIQELNRDVEESRNQEEKENILREIFFLKGQVESRRRDGKGATAVSPSQR